MHLNLPDINPVIFAFGPFHLFGHDLGPISVRWYALAYVMGIVLGWVYAGYLLRKETLWSPRKPPVNSEQLDDLILWLTLGIIIGGRIGYIIAYDTSIIWEHPWEMLQIWNGGMSFHGGFVGVVIATILYCRSQKFDARQMLNLGDLLASVAPIGLMFGRFANFINGELWGRPTTLPWGMDFCNTYIRQQYGNCPADPQGLPVFRHPSQLYEAALEGVVLFSVMWILSYRLKKLQKPGLVMGTFIAGYGLVRILLENVRNPDAQMPEFLRHFITMGMILSLPMVIVGGFFIWNALRSETTPENDRQTPGHTPDDIPEITIELPVKSSPADDETAA